MRSESGSASWWEQPLPIARYQFEAQMRDSLAVPVFVGNLLRSPFGASLRTVACTTGTPQCGGCPSMGHCTYARVFDGALAPDAHHRQKGFAQVPNPYIIAPMPGNSVLQPGDLLRWQMVVVGHAIERMEEITIAWQRALQHGIGSARARAYLTQPPCLLDPAPNLQVPPSPWNTGPMTLHFLAPLRLQQQGGLIGPQKLDTQLLLSALARRIGLLLALHADNDAALIQTSALPQVAKNVGIRTDLQWFDQVRYSARQRQEMPMGGLLGTITLQCTDASVAHTLWPWLWLGQWLHIGKNATMGLGQYRLDWQGSLHNV